MNAILLDLLCFGSVLSGILVITSRNPIISVLFLIAVFVNVACYLILLGINFIGILYIVIYVGAIAILFLFVVMMINVKLAEIKEYGVEQSQHYPLALLLGSLFLVLIHNFSVVGKFSYVSIFDMLNNSAFGGPSGVVLNYNGYYGFSRISTDMDLRLLGFSWDNSFLRFDQIESLGLLLYGPYTLYLLLLSVILLLAMISVIVVTQNSSDKY
jgi:NADH-ubiquinone oxidoreductase chain 6